MASSGTVGESAYEVLTFFGDLLDFLDAEPPKNGEEPIRLLKGRGLREFSLLAERQAESGIDGLLVTFRIVLSRITSSAFIFS
jgi:hypothetical protein